MKKLLKAFGIILAFAILYVAIMIGVYHFLYKYPEGYLDDVERNDGALLYHIVYKEEVGKTADTLLYFSRSKNGAGDKMHVGTIERTMPTIIANFFCEGKSSVYFPINAYGYVSSLDTDHMCYLFGATSDLNTVKVVVEFKTDNGVVEVETVYAKQVFYCLDFDASLAQYPSYVYGYNENNGITFEYGGDALSDGGYIARDKNKAAK